MRGQPHTLTTERLRLCPAADADAPALLALFRTVYVRRYLFDDGLVDLDWVRAAIRESAAMFAREGYGLWTMSRIGAAPLLGFCGFILEANEPRLIYGLAEDAAGGGLAREAARAVIDHAAARGLRPVRASVDGENTASRALLPRPGLQIVSAEPGRLGEVFLYALKR